MATVTSAATSGGTGAGRRGGLGESSVVATPASSWRGRFLRQTSRPPEAIVRATQPFENQTPVYGVFGWVKSILLVPLALVRVVMILLLVVALAIYFGIVRCCCGRCLRRKANGAPAFGAFLLTPLRWAARALLFCFGYLWIEEVYPRGTPLRQRCAFCCCSPSFLRRRDVPSVLVPTHHSFMDSLIIVSRVLPSVVGKAAIVRMPVVGPIIAALDPILVPRTPEEKASLPPVLEAIVDRARAGVAAGDSRPRGPPVMIFPEGTTVNQRHVITFQHGAFVPGVPVQPICIAYPFCALDVSIPPHVPNWRVLLRQLACLYNRAVVTYLPPQEPPVDASSPATDSGVGAGHGAAAAGDTGSPASASTASAVAATANGKLTPSVAGLFAKIVRAKMASALGRSLAPHTDRDALLVGEARERHADLGAYTVARVLPSLLTRDMEAALRVALRMPALAAFVDAFARCDATGDGYLRPDDLGLWVHCLLLPTAEQRAFRELLPRGGRGGTLPSADARRKLRRAGSSSNALIGSAAPAVSPSAGAGAGSAAAAGSLSTTLLQGVGSPSAISTAGPERERLVPRLHSGYVAQLFAALEEVRVLQQQANHHDAATHGGGSAAAHGRPSAPPLLLSRESSSDAATKPATLPERAASGDAVAVAVASVATARGLLSPLDLFTAFSVVRHGVPIPQGEEGVGLAHWTHMLPEDHHHPTATAAGASTVTQAVTDRSPLAASARAGSAAAPAPATVTAPQLRLAVALLSFGEPGVVDAGVVGELLARQAHWQAQAAGAAAPSPSPSPSQAGCASPSAGAATPSSPASASSPTSVAGDGAASRPPGAASLSGAQRAAAVLPGFRAAQAAVSVDSTGTGTGKLTAGQLESWRAGFALPAAGSASEAEAGGGAGPVAAAHGQAFVTGVVTAAAELLWAAWGLGSKALEPARATGAAASAAGSAAKPQRLAR